MINWLAENQDYKIYALSENVYLKRKSNSGDCNNSYSDNDIFITSFYGDPCCAIISKNNAYCVIAGQILVIYFFESNNLIELWSNDTYWPTGLHQDISNDGSWDFFRFIAYNSKNKLSIFKANTNTLKTEEITCEN